MVWFAICRNVASSLKPSGACKVPVLVPVHVQQSLEGLWHGADAPKDGGGPEGACPEQHWAPRWMATLSFLLAHILGQDAGPTQPPWSWDMPAAPSAISGWKAALGPYYGIAKASLEKKKDVNYGHEPSFHLQASS